MDNWISVKTKMPDKDGFYRVKVAYSDDETVRDYSVVMKVFTNYDGYKVTHWLPNDEENKIVENG